MVKNPPETIREGWHRWTDSRMLLPLGGSPIAGPPENSVIIKATLDLKVGYVRGCSSKVNEQRVRKDQQVPGAPENRSGALRQGSRPGVAWAGGLTGHETAGSWRASANRWKWSLRASKCWLWLAEASWKANGGKLLILLLQSTSLCCHLSPESLRDGWVNSGQIVLSFIIFMYKHSHWN